ncbi:polyprotein, partial [Rice Picorna-like virus 1]
MPVIRYIEVSKSRNHGRCAALRITTTFSTVPKTYDRPIGPRNRPPPMEWEKYVVKKLTRKYLGDEETFLYKYYNLIHAMDKKVNKQRAVVRPWTRGMAFTQAIIKAWKVLTPAYLRLVHRRERKMRRKEKVSASRSFSFARMCDILYPGDDSDVPSCFDEEGVPMVCARKTKVRNTPLPKWDKTNPIFHPTLVPPRNANLLAILRTVIAFLRSKRMSQHMRSSPPRGKIIKNKITSLFRNGTPYANHEGNEAVEQIDQDLSPTIHESNRVCIVETHDCSAVNIPSMNIPPSLGAGDIDRRFDALLMDEIAFANFEWEDKALGTELTSFTLPSAAFSELKSNAIMAPFLVHQYWRGDLQVRVVVNANKFQSGQLQVSWWYDALSDSKFNLRENVFTASQTPHALVNAGTSNECCLNIGYRSPFSCLPITGASKTDDCLNMGKLVIRVLAPLKSSDSVAKKCSVTVFIKFLNSQFFGARGADVGKFVAPEMMEGAMALASLSVAERALNQVLPDVNRDNPPVPGPSMHMVPQAMQSLCCGTGASEPINHLRLDARGQVPHLEKPNTLSRWSDIAKTYGLIRTEVWSKDHIYGKELFSIHAAPIHPLNTYSAQTIESDACYALPPVAVASSLFSYWRGSLKLRLDLVATAMHTGKLAVVYIPRTLSAVTWDQAKGSPHVIIDLKDGVQSYTINIPFITNRYAWPRRIDSSDNANVVDPPGMVYVFVINKLIPMEAVSNEVQINVYLAGGDSFELLVPCQPAFGTSFFTTHDRPSDEIKAYGGYWPFYWGYYSDFFGGIKAIARYGKGWQHVAQFQNLKYNCYYTANAKTLSAMPPYMYKNDGTQFTPKYFVPIDLNDGTGLRYMGVCENEANARKYASLPPNKKDFSLLMDVQNNDNGPWSDSSVNPVFDASAVPIKTDIKFVTFARPENDPNLSEATQDAPVVLECVPPPSKEISPITFGENFDDIKTLTRRYQPYCVFEGTTSPDIGTASVALPLVPQGLDLDIDAYEQKGKFYNKYVRDGTIPIISSAYRYMRGSMRLRFVLPSDVKCNIWVQHRPDSHADKWSPKMLGDRDITSCYLNTGYSTGFQTTKVNNTYSVEVPFYQPFSFILAQRTDLTRPVAQSVSSLGTMFIGFEQTGGAAKKFPVSIFYSLGDDASFEYFLGFPPMVPINKKTSVSEMLQAATHEGLFDKIVTSASASIVNSETAKGVAMHVVESVEDTLNKVVTDEGIQINHKIKLDDVNFKIDISEETRDFLNNSGSQSAEFVERILGTDKPDEATSIAQQFISWLSTISGGVINFGVDLVSQIMHCVINPVKEAVAIATVTILVKLGVINGNFFDKLITHGKKMLDYFNICNPSSSTPTEPNETGGAPQADHESNFDIITNFIDVAFVAVSTVLQTSISPPRCIADFTKVLTKEISQNVRSANQITLFMKNNILLFKKVAEYCTAYINKDKFLEKIVQDEMVPLMAWVDECEILLDPQNEERSYAKDSEWAHRIEEAYVVGCSVNKHFENYVKSNSGHRELYDMFKRLFQRIMKRREDMFKRGNGTVSRREPFSIWIYGTAGVGKSQLAQHIIPRLLESNGISYYGEPIYTLPSGAKYWTGCRAQPAILLDDFLNVQTGEIRDESIRHIFAIKSPAALNPPMAHLEDKELRYMPEILVICSNHEFPACNNVHMEAVWRRREVLLKCTISPELGAGGYNNLSDNFRQVKDYCRENNIDYTKFEHMRMVHALNPSEPTTGWSQPHSIETLMEKLKKDFTDYRNDQHELYERRKAEYDRRIRAASGDLMSISEKREEYRRLCTALHAYKWHERVPFKEILRLSHIYSATGTISDEMRSCLIDQDRLVKEDFASTRVADPENDETKPYVDPAVADPPLITDVGMSARLDAIDSSEKITADTTEFAPPPPLNVTTLVHNEVRCKMDAAEKGDKISLDNLICLTHSGSSHDRNSLKEKQACVQSWFSLKVPFECFAAEVLYELIMVNKLKKAVPISDMHSCGIPYIQVKIFDGIAKLFCLHCNCTLEGASTHAYCAGIKYLNVNLPIITTLFTPKSVYFYGNKEQIATLEQVSSMSIVDAIRVLYMRKDIWPNVHPDLQNLLKPVLCIQLKVHDHSKLDEILESKYKNESEISRIITAGKVIETIKKEYPKCTHGKIKYSHSFMYLTADDKRAFQDEDLDNEEKIYDEPCGEECVLTKRPELGEALYNEWCRHNPTAECKPQYFVNLKAKAKDTPEVKDTGEETSKHKRFFTKVRRCFTGLWDKVKKLGDWMWKYIKPCLRPLWKFMKYFIVFFLLIGALWGIYAVATGSAATATFATAATAVGSAVAGAGAQIGATWTRMTSRSPTVVTTPNHEGATTYTETLSAASRNPAPKPVVFARHQSNPNSQKMNEILRIIERNTYFASSTNGSTWSRILGIYENYFLIMKHYYESWINNGVKTITVWRSDNTARLTVNLSDVHCSSLPDKSLAILKINTMGYCRKITHLFASLKDHTVPRGMCFMLEVMPSSSVFIHELRVQSAQNLNIRATETMEGQQLETVYTYPWHGNGRCGSYLIAPHLNHPIIGIHCAGSGNQGYADPVASEFFSEFNGESFEAGYNTDDSPNPNFKGSYIPIGRTDQNMAHQESGVSRIQQSLIAGVFPIVSAPAPLRKGDPRVPVEEGEVYSPLWAGVSNMGRLTKDFPTEHRDNAKDYLAQRIVTLAPPTRDSCGVLSCNDAVCGIPGLPHYESINFSTSEGFPWSRFRPKGCSNKEWLFDFDTDEHGHRVLYSINNLLWDQITHEIQDRIDGNHVATIFDDCLKDARTPLDKIAKHGKTRIFSISPVQYTIVFKMYFGDFLSAFTSARLQLNHAIGISCDGCEWGALVRALCSKGTYFVTGDYKNFGPGLNTACLIAACDVILAWYDCYDTTSRKEENQRVRRALLRELTCAKHCAHDFIYSVLAGLPSGCPATAPLNSLVNELYLMCAWMGIMHGTEYAALNHFFS